MSGEGFGGLAGAAAAELHLKMSKKIAQLTKVIFHLNTRNEDFQSEFAHAKHAHARELAQLTQDAATKLRLLHEQLRAQTSAAQLAERRADAERQQLQHEMAQFQLQVRATQNAAELSFRQRVAQLEAQVDASQRAFSERAQQLARLAETQQQAASLSSSSALAAARSAHEAQLEELQVKKNDEATQLVTASNAKYNQMLAEQLRAQDALRDACAALEQQLAHLKSEHEAQAAAAEKAARERFDLMKHQLVSKMETVLADAEQLRGHETKLRQEKEALLLTQSELQRQLKQLELQVAKAQQEAQSVRKDADATAQRLQQLLAAGTEKIDALALELETLRKALQTRDQALRQAQKDLEAAQLETLQRSASLSEKDALLRQQTQERELQLANARAEAQTHQQQRALAETNLQRRIQVLEAQVETATKELAGLRATLATCEAQRALLQKEKEKTLDDLKAKSDEGDRNTLELKRLHASERAEMVAAHTQAMQQQQVEMETKLHALKMQLTQHSSDSLEKAVAQLKSEHAKAANDAKAAADAAQQALKQEVARLETQLKALQSDAAAKDKELAELRAKVCELTAQLRRDHDKLTSALSEKEAQLKASEKVRKEKEDALLKQIKELGGQRESAAKKLASEKEQLQLQHSQTLVALARDHDAKLKTLRDEWETQTQLELHTQTKQLTEHYEHLLATLRGDLLALQTQLEREAGEAQDAQRSLRESRLLDHECYRGSMLRHLSRVAAERQREEQSSQLRMRATLDQHAEELEKLGDRLRKEKQQLLAKAQADADARSAQLIANHREDLEQRYQQHALATKELHERLEAKHHSEVLAIRADNTQKTRELTAQKDRERAEALREAQSRHDDAFDTLQKQAEHSQSSLTQKILELNSSTRDNERLRSAVDAKTKEMAEKVAALERASREHIETLKKAAKQDMDRLLEENLTETKLLSDQFEETRRLMTDKIALLKQAVSEWEERYARRESRPEDVNRIAELERLVVEKEALVRQTLDEMAYFKRELLNREEMYNKTFARAPNVGVLNVLKPHVQMQAQMQAGLALGGGTAPQTKRKTKPAHVVGGPEVQGGDLQRRNSERASSSGSSGGTVKKSLPPLQNNQVAM